MAEKSTGDLSLSQVITSGCDFTFRQCLDINKLVPLLTGDREGKFKVPKRSQKKFSQAKERDDIDFLLIGLRKLDLVGFAAFLEAIESLKHVGEHYCILSFLATELRHVNLPSPCDLDEQMEKDAVKAIEDFTVTYIPGVSKESSTTESVSVIDESSRHTPTSENIPSTLSQPQETLITDVSSLSLSTTMSTSKSAQLEDLEPDSTVPEQAFAQPVYLSEVHSRVCEDTEVTTITKVGGIIFSSTHGVTVSITKEAVPVGLDKFDLRLSASIGSSVKVPDGYELVSAVVELTCDPPIREFADFVTVSLPHWMVDADDSLDNYCILSCQDDSSPLSVFTEDPDIKIDLSQFHQRCISFNTKHFCRFSLAKSSMKRKQRRSLRIATKAKNQHPAYLRSISLSLQSDSTSKPQESRGRSQSEPQDIRVSKQCQRLFQVAVVSPKNKNQPTWKILLFFSYAGCTGKQEIQRSAQKYFGVKSLNAFDTVWSTVTFERHVVEVVLGQSTNAYWGVKATKIPSIISKGEIISHMSQQRSKRSKSCFYPHLAYDVIKSQTPAEVDSVTCVDFTLEGARPFGCETAEVMFSLTLPNTSAGSQVLSGVVIEVLPQLYSSDILPMIHTARSDATLSVSHDTAVFISEISFYLREYSKLAEDLKFPEFEIHNWIRTYGKLLWPFDSEASYEVLYKWIKDSTTQRTLGELLAILERMAISVCVYPNKPQPHLCLAKHILDQPISLSDIVTFTKLSMIIASQWKFVARFLGLSEPVIASLNNLHEGIVECAYQMLFYWVRHDGKATVEKLAMAVWAVEKHTSGSSLKCALETLICHYIGTDQLS